MCYDYGAHSPETSDRVQRWVYDAHDPWAVAKSLQRDGLVMLGGHVRAGKYAPLLGIRRTVTFVRDPVQRLVSAYRHWRRYLGFEGSFEAFYQRRGSIDQQSRYLDGIPAAAFGLVGVTERYDASLALLNELFGVALERREDNQSVAEAAPEAAVTAAQAEEIRALNPKDTALYEACLAQLAERERLHEAGARYAHGGLLRCRPREVVGWAWWERGEAPVEVEVYINDALAGVAQAAELCPPALAWGPPRGGYVRFRLPLQARPGDTVACRVREQGQCLATGEIVRPKGG